MIFLAIYYTNSRGAIVGLGATMVAYSFVKFSKPKAVIVAAVLIGIIAVAAPSRGSEISFGESSAQTRIQSWAEGWAMLKSHPFTGVGYDQYTEYNRAVAHNSFVHTFAELGFTGAFIFVGMFYWYFKGLALIPGTNTECAPWRRALTDERRRHVHLRLVPVSTVRGDLLCAARAWCSRYQPARAAGEKGEAANVPQRTL